MEVQIWAALDRNNSRGDHAWVYNTIEKPTCTIIVHGPRIRTCVTAEMTKKRFSCCATPLLNYMAWRNVSVRLYSVSQTARANESRLQGERSRRLCGSVALWLISMHWIVLTVKSNAPYSVTKRVLQLFMSIYCDVMERHFIGMPLDFLDYITDVIFRQL